MFQIYDLDAGKFWVTENGDPISFPSGKDAADFCQKFPGSRLKPQAAGTILDWKEKAQLKFATGEYFLPAFLKPYVREEHFVHISKENSECLAYIQDENKGKQGVSTKISVSGYLEKYSKADNAKRQDLLREFQAYSMERYFKIAMTPEEIAQAYSNYDPYGTIAGSCMSKPFQHLDIHPASVYGAGDLGIAYLVNFDGRTTHRALVWPEKKIYSRTYGATDTLHKILRSKGYEKSIYYGIDYSKNTFKEARLKVVELESGTFLMPYIDENVGIYKKGDYFYLRGDGFRSYNTKSTSGSTRDLQNPYRCGQCGVRFRNGYVVYGVPGTLASVWCMPCSGVNAFKCDSCNTYYDKRHHTSVKMVNGEIWHQQSFINYGGVCEKTGLNVPRNQLKRVYLTADKSRFQSWYITQFGGDTWRDLITGHFYIKDVPAMPVHRRDPKRVAGYTTLTEKNSVYLIEIEGEYYLKESA